MRRVVESRESKHIGKCIYCGVTNGPLTEEHIAPYGLNGAMTLSAASCRRCAAITSEIERRILKIGLFAARAALKLRTRRIKDRAKPQPMVIEKAGVQQRVDVPWQDHWKVIQLPIYPLPACIDGRPYTGGIEAVSKDVFELGERGEDIAKRHGADKVIPPHVGAEDFARLIAKMGYGYAVERYGLDAFESVYVLPAILAQSNDVGRWVGCSDRREFPVRQCAVSVGYKILPGDDLMVKIKMFPQFDGAEYVVVVGRVKAVYRDYHHARGEGDEVIAMPFTLEYTTYENTHNPHVTIHLNGCLKIREHGGNHKYNQGRYQDHESYDQAHAYAVRTGILPIKNCAVCKPR